MFCGQRYPSISNPFPIASQQRLWGRGTATVLTAPQKIHHRTLELDPINAWHDRFATSRPRTSLPPCIPLSRCACSGRLQAPPRSLTVLRSLGRAASSCIFPSRDSRCAGCGRPIGRPMPRLYLIFHHIPFFNALQD